MDRRDGGRGRLGAALLAGLLLVGLLLVTLPSSGDVVPAGTDADNAAFPSALLGAALDREASLRAARGAPGAQHERTVTRTAYAHLSRADALRVGRRELEGLFRARLGAPPDLRDGEHAAGYLGDNAMRVSRPGHPDAIVESTMPLRVTDDAGDKAPVDLTLHSTASAFAPVNAPAPIRIAKDLRDGVRFDGAGFSMKPTGLDGATDGVETSGKVFFANTSADTDLLVAPLPNGAETF